MLNKQDRNTPKRQEIVVYLKFVMTIQQMVLHHIDEAANRGKEADYVISLQAGTVGS